MSNQIKLLVGLRIRYKLTPFVTRKILIFQVVGVARFHSITPSLDHFLLDIRNPR